MTVYSFTGLSEFIEQALDWRMCFSEVVVVVEVVPPGPSPVHHICRRSTTQSSVSAVWFS